MPDPTRADLDRIIEEQKADRDRLGSAHDSLKTAKTIEPPKGTQGPLKKFRATLRKAIHKTKQRIADRKVRITAIRRDLRAGGAAKAMQWAAAQIGTTESPPGSNWGPKISEWIKFTGYSSPVPWCGCFVAYVTVKIGGCNIPNRIRLGYTPSIVADARANTNGLRAVPYSDARLGDIAVYDFGGSGAVHTGMVEKRIAGGIVAIEGNTSSSNAGSQSNGGGVFRRNRTDADLICVARPIYP